jgi:hypothetical protein
LKQFNDSKYTKWYFNIIRKAKSEPRAKGNEYYERHHITPRCLDGNDTEYNLVLLTAKEHYVCHWLLCKMVDESIRYKLYFAFWRMTQSTAKMQAKKFNARQYEIARIKHKEACQQFGGFKKGKPIVLPDIEQRRQRMLARNSDPEFIALSAERRAQNI